VGLGAGNGNRWLRHFGFQGGSWGGCPCPRPVAGGSGSTARLTQQLRGKHRRARNSSAPKQRLGSPSRSHGRSRPRAGTLVGPDPGPAGARAVPLPCPSAEVPSLPCPGGRRCRRCLGLAELLPHRRRSVLPGSLRILESQNHSGWKRPLRPSSPTIPAPPPCLLDRVPQEGAGKGVYSRIQQREVLEELR